jgi:hypothetical protein
MKKGTRIRAMVILSLFCLSMAAAAETSQPQAQKASTANRGRTGSAAQQHPRYSVKCGIYSGICPMFKPMEVGSYCICNTPTGQIYGVVVP